MKVVLRRSGKRATLSERNFIAQGGEGSVYAVGDLAVKVYEDPSKMIPEGKIRELAEIATDDILAPHDVVLRQSTDEPMGYAMKRADGCLPLPKIYPRSWRTANGFGPNEAMRLVLGIRSNFEHVHGHGALVVDANDMNFLARKDFSSAFHIDVDSYRTRSYPPTAIMPSVRDPLTDEFTTETDWYSFAILSFAILVGVHPFKGSHPDYKPGQLLERMKDGASALLPEVRLPKPAMPLDVIPKSWRAWYESVFTGRYRGVPPVTSERLALAVSVVEAMASGDLVDLRKVLDVISPPLEIVRDFAGLSVRVLDHGYDAMSITPRGRCAVFFSLGSDGFAQCYGDHGDKIGEPFRADDIISSYGTTHARRGEDLLELRFVEAGKTLVIPERIGSLAPHASKLYPGVAIQQLLGATYASLLPKPGRCVQVRLKEVEGSRVVDARFVGGRGPDGATGCLQVLAESGGSLDLHTWHGLSADRFSRYDVDSDIGAHEINLAELDTGVCVVGLPDGTVSLFRPGGDKRKIVKDPALDGRLFADGGDLLVASGNAVYRARLK